MFTFNEQRKHIITVQSISIYDYGENQSISNSRSIRLSIGVIQKYSAIYMILHIIRMNLWVWNSTLNGISSLCCLYSQLNIGTIVGYIFPKEPNLSLAIWNGLRLSVTPTYFQTMKATWVYCPVACPCHLWFLLLRNRDTETSPMTKRLSSNGFACVFSHSYTKAAY